MKTSVNMIRKMGNFEVTQRTKDSMFCATDLIKQWNKHSGMQKQMVHFMENKSTIEFIETLMDQDETKERNYVVMQTRGKNGGTWMHPFLFIDFAMWINPKFKLDVIKFVYDQLIEFRHDAGDMYIGLTNALTKFKNVDYRQVAKGLNWIVFDKHENGIRQKATQKELKELTDVQKTLAFSITMGYISSYKSLINEMRRLYHMRTEKF
jgi:hypothetical protein